MLVRDLLAVTALRMTSLTGDRGLERPVRWVCTSDLPDPRNQLSGGELVLTGLMWRRTAADSTAFVAKLASRQVAALAAGDAAYGTVPEDLVVACREYGIPLLEVPVDVSFSSITEHVVTALTAERQEDLAGLLRRRRRMVTSVAQHAGLDALLALSAADAEVPCRLLTATGRVPAMAPTAVDAALSARLAKEFLVAEQFPAVARIGRGGAKSTYSLFPIGEDLRPRVAGWFLGCEGDHRQWTAEVRESVLELADLVSLERERREQDRRTARAAVERLLRSALAGDGPEVAARFPATGLDDRRYVAVAATVTPSPGGALARTILVDLLAPIAGAPTRIVQAATIGSEAIGLAPVDDDPALVTRRLRELTPLLSTGLGGHRLHLGTSLPASGPGGLGAAVTEARLARRMAELRPERVALVSSDEIDSHTLLLAAVPEEVRLAFRARVLGPIVEYDRVHGGDLVATLAAFLETSCSWTHCAEKMHLHVNTLRYRIQRIEELSGRSLSTLDGRVDFYLALRTG